MVKNLNPSIITEKGKSSCARLKFKSLCYSVANLSAAATIITLRGGQAGNDDNGDLHRTEHQREDEDWQIEIREETKHSCEGGDTKSWNGAPEDVENAFGLFQEIEREHRRNDAPCCKTDQYRDVDEEKDGHVQEAPHHSDESRGENDQRDQSSNAREPFERFSVPSQARHVDTFKVFGGGVDITGRERAFRDVEGNHALGLHNLDHSGVRHRSIFEGVIRVVCRREAHIRNARGHAGQWIWEVVFDRLEEAVLTIGVKAQKRAAEEALRDAVSPAVQKRVR